MSILNQFKGNNSYITDVILSKLNEQQHIAVLSLIKFCSLVTDLYGHDKMAMWPSKELGHLKPLILHLGQMEN